LRSVLNCVAAATVALGAGVAGSAAADTRALLVGVADYVSEGITDLSGPENDLAAMENLLRGQGATDITVLKNADATRTAIETAVHALGLRAKPGDWLVVYFSGHGAQAAAAEKGQEEDGLDEFLVLSGFDMNAPKPDHYITDNDFHTWFARYVSPQVQVLHIADACHSGTLNRSIDRRAWRFKPRLAVYRGDKPLELARAAPLFPSVTGAGVTASTSDPAELPNVIFIGAAQDDQLALEASWPVETAPTRGIMTWAFQQGVSTYGVDGKTLAADADRDGFVQVAEIASYLDTQTRQMTGQRQQASTRFAAGRDKISLFEKIAAKVQAPLPPAKPYVYAADPRAQALLAGGADWVVGKSPLTADFNWDFRTGSVLRRSGDVVAQGVTTLPQLKGVLEKWATLEAFRPMLSEANSKLVIGPQRNGARYKGGERVDLALTRTQGGKPGYATVFNLASDGTVQTIYPLADDGDGRLPAGGGPLAVLSTRVIEPYGADHVVALVTPERPDSFRRLLSTVENKRGSAQLTAAVKEELRKGGATSALSVGELYTGS
jgi:hypothetical protein